MLISIIVPVYNRADETDDFLNSFTTQTNKNFDIIIVDDGSSDNLTEVIKKYESQLPIKYFRQQNKGPGEARNLGMEKSTSDYYVFIDSDCTVPADYVENIINSLEKYKCDAFGGPDTYRKDFAPFLKAINYSMTSFIGTGGTRGSSGKQVAKYYPRTFNMGIKKEVFEKIGGMRRIRHGEDMEFSNRIYKAGFKVSYFPDVKVYHKRRTSPRKFFKQMFNNGVARINLGRIDKAMLKPVHFLPFLVVTGFLLTLIGSFFSAILQILLLIELIIGIFVAMFSFFQSLFEYKQLNVAILSVFTIFFQVFGYGLGFIYGLIKAAFSKKDKIIEGYTKTYYK